MGHKSRTLAWLALSVAAGGGSISATAQDPAAQGTPPSAPASAAQTKSTGDEAGAKQQDSTEQGGKVAGAKKDPAVAQRAYAAGTKAFEAGKMGDAIQQLTAGLASGGLASQQMAKALYYRGVAYRKQGKPAQAISDLTTAVWLKGGLSDADRAQAIENRQMAYREAGLGDTAPPVPTQQPSAPAASTPVKPGTTVVSVPAQSSFWSFLFPSETPQATAPGPPPAAPPVATAAPDILAWQTATIEDSTAKVLGPDAPPVPVAPPEPQLSQLAATPGDTATSAPPSPVPAPPVDPIAGPVLAAAVSESGPALPAADPLATAGDSTGGFFGSLFGSGPAPPKPPAETSSVNAATVPAGPSYNDEWGGATSVAPARATKATVPLVEKTAAVIAPPVIVEAPGKYRLQVAAVRSREEAERLVASLKTAHRSQIGAVEPEVDEAAIGNMGTFYRVRLGPYADAAEPAQLCNTLRPQGFDCLVVAK